MKAAALVLAAACACAPLAIPHAAIALDAGQQTGALPRGGSYVIARDPALGAAAVDLWFRAPGAGYDFASPGIARLAATAAAATKLAGGKSLAELIRASGGSISINVYPDMLGVSVVVPAASVRRAVAALTAAYFAPAIDDNALKSAQRDAAVLAVEQRYSADLTLHNLLFAALFSGGAAHAAPLPDSIPQLTSIPRERVSAFASRAFRAPNAVLSLAGNVDASVISAVTDGKKGTADRPFDPARAESPSSTSASGAVSGVGLAWTGPPIADERAATAMDFIADYLFRDASGTVSKALAADDETYVLGQFITLHDPGVMMVTIGGKNVAAARTAVADAIAKVTSPLDSATFDAAREAFVYHIAVDIQSPQEQADNLGWYASEGNATYAPGWPGGDYVKSARSLDAAYVARIAQRYLQHPTVVQLLAATKESSS